MTHWPRPPALCPEVGRIGQPRDIAQTVAFLSSDAAAFISGAITPVDGAGTA
ncbi:SDR family oxidoreductase [Streptomyces coffeae]|uniref:SDR family oxidoreductase n=1 Tax=Streptomyces coffeae TaxID=621382 RepID=UPI001F45250C|nr:SDR family oxidoreductase [Streptomyces coffeae]